jgi:hypothetical protein
MEPAADGAAGKAQLLAYFLITARKGQDGLVRLRKTADQFLVARQQRKLAESLSALDPGLLRWLGLDRPNIHPLSPFTFDTPINCERVPGALVPWENSLARIKALRSRWKAFAAARINPMPIPVTAGAFAIVPSNDLAAAMPFWKRPGFSSGSAGLHALCRMRPQIPADASDVFRRRQRSWIEPLPECAT